MMAALSPVGHVRSKSFEGKHFLELRALKDEPLLVRGNVFLVLDLALHHVDCVRRRHLEIDGLARERLDKQVALPRVPGAEPSAGGLAPTWPPGAPAGSCPSAVSCPPERLRARVRQTAAASLSRSRYGAPWRPPAL